MNKTTLNTLFSSETGDWSTPIDFFNRLDQEYNFTLDPCASVANATCDYYFTEQDNGLNQDWGGYSVFMNPPYGRKISKWVQKAYEESCKGLVVVVLTYFIKGRLKFGASVNSAPFPSAVVVFADEFKPRLHTMQSKSK